MPSNKEPLSNQNRENILKHNGYVAISERKKKDLSKI